MFYVGRYLWKIWEGGKLKMLVMDLNKPILSDAEKRRSNLVEYFRLNIGKHSLYFWKFFFCEILNIVNVIGQIFFTDMLVIIIILLLLYHYYLIYILFKY